MKAFEGGGSYSSERLNLYGEWRSWWLYLDGRVSVLLGWNAGWAAETVWS
jgi:hypothetical protein